MLIAPILEGIGVLGKVAKDLREAITGRAIEDPNKRREIELKLIELERQFAEAQLKINAAEAAHPSTFVAGWRPAVGWICALGVAMKVIVRPIAQWIVTTLGLTNAAGQPIILPDIPVDVLVTLLLGLLGLGGLRTYEGVKGIKRSHWKIE